jgi:hypothetical protein
MQPIDVRIRLGSIIQVVSLQSTMNTNAFVLRCYQRKNSPIPGCLDAFLPDRIR